MSKNKERGERKAREKPDDTPEEGDVVEEWTIVLQKHRL